MRSAGAAGTALAWPAFVPSSVFGNNAPSNRITIGSIGVGGCLYGLIQYLFFGHRRGFGMT